ncbi:MAG: hypothetical protein L0Y73_08180, partial [Candidatus Aminicenantes bacterium]|nr:hypothetical protein [Candidatus Aminicenantes bacterium]
GKTRLFKKADLFNHIDGGAELFLEFGFEDLLVQRYKQDKKEITLELYRMENPTAALGIYLFKCGKETPLPAIPARNSADPYQFTIVKGNYFLQVNNPTGEDDALAVMRALVVQVLKELHPGEPEKLLRLLPERDLLAGTASILRGPYALQKIFFFGEGDLLQLKGKVFAAAGDYENSSSGRYTLILIPYTGPEAARSAFLNLVAHLDPLIEILERKESGFIFKDFQNKYGIVEAAGSLISIKVNLAKEK